MGKVWGQIVPGQTIPFVSVTLGGSTELLHGLITSGASIATGQRGSPLTKGVRTNLFQDELSVSRLTPQKGCHIPTQ